MTAAVPIAPVTGVAVAPLAPDAAVVTATGVTPSGAPPLPLTPGVALPAGRDVAPATGPRAGTLVGFAAAPAAGAVARTVGTAVACSARADAGFGVVAATAGVGSDGSALRGSLTVRAAKTATPTAIRSATPSHRMPPPPRPRPRGVERADFPAVSPDFFVALAEARAEFPAPLAEDRATRRATLAEYRVAIGAHRRLLVLQTVHGRVVGGRCFVVSGQWSVVSCWASVADLVTGDE